MGLKQYILLSNAVMALFFLAPLQGCGGGEFDEENEGLGKAEQRDLCSGQFVAGWCFPEEMEVKVSLYVISAKLAEKNVLTDETWDDVSVDTELPDPLVNIYLYEPSSDEGDEREYRVQTEFVDDTTEPVWEKTPLSIWNSQAGAAFADLPLSYIKNPANYLSVEDKDLLIPDPMGQCAIDPTDDEIATGIIVAKSCFSEEEIDGETVRLTGRHSNIQELTLGIKVPEPATQDD